MLARGMPAVQALEAFVPPGIGTAATGLTLPSGDTSSVRTHLPTKGGRAQTTCAIEGGEFLSCSHVIRRNHFTACMCGPYNIRWELVERTLTKSGSISQQGCVRGMKDTRGVERGRCRKCPHCVEYTPPDQQYGQIKCIRCNCPPGAHENLATKQAWSNQPAALPTASAGK